ncbi:hypothetical protein AGMMS49938_08950 [Fibrobacterales bacterium]|nr:hypothetical protein AGMMS49938_08950 [Fibrobacterales bacterium]
MLFYACSDDSSGANFPFERTVLDVSVTPRCADGTFKPGTACYLLQWRHPIEHNNLETYYIWLDTLTVKDSAQNISQAQMNAGTAVAYSGKGEGDSLNLTELISKYLERDSVHLAIWAKYKSGDQGAVQHLYIYFGDDIAPAIVQFNDSASANRIWIDFMRPADQRDFYFPDVLNGAIAGYNVVITAQDAAEDIREAKVSASLAGNAISSADLRKFYRFKNNGRAVALEATDSKNARILRFALLDGKGFDSENSENNNWKLEILGLKPEHSYSVSIVAWDSAGNPSSAESGGRVIATTDSIAPLITDKFFLYADSNDGLPRLDSNRLILFWERSIDPLIKGCSQSSCSSFREVQTYIVEQWNGKTWESVPRISVIGDDYYGKRYSLADSVMQANTNGIYVSDTLRWVVHNDTLILRIRAVDFSGHYSAAWIDTVALSKGWAFQTDCPPNFVPVKRDSTVFCMEKFEHSASAGGGTSADGEFLHAVLYGEAVSTCKDEGYDLCTEDEWNAACNSGKSSYGVIEEKGFLPSEFLFRYCGAGTGDSLGAISPNLRKKICTSPDGVRDLPGQLQEWVKGKDSTGKETPILKGTSYMIFEGASRTELAQCKIKATPTRIRPKWTQDSVYLYRNGSRIDTLLVRDTLRTLYSVSFTDTILIYNLSSKGGVELGEDFVDNAEFMRRGREEWLKELWRGLNYTFKEKRVVLILGTQKVNAEETFIESSVGFRCCSRL